MRKYLLALAAMACLALPACTQLGIGDPAQTEGALPQEANELRLIRASLVVTGAYEAVGEQVEKGVITKAEALKAVDVIDKARSAVKAAQTALTVGDATLDQKLAFLDAMLLELIQQQALKGV